MLTSIPFKGIVDSRNAAIGTTNRVSISLPETLHADIDVVTHVNSASVTNTFLPTGTNISKKNHYFYWFKRFKNVDTESIESCSQNVYTLPKNLQTYYKPRLAVHRGLAITTNTRVLTIKTNKRLQYCDQMRTNAVFHTSGTTCVPNTNKYNDGWFRAVYNKLERSSICNGSVWARCWNERES